MEWWRGPAALNYGKRAVLGFFAGVPPPEFLVMPLLMGRSAYIARAGLKSQSAPGYTTAEMTVATLRATGAAILGTPPVRT